MQKNIVEHLLSTPTQGRCQKKMLGVDLWGSVDSERTFVHFMNFLTGTRSSGGFEPRNPPKYVKLSE